MISYDEALQQVMEAITHLNPVDAPLNEASGLFLYESATARWDMPRCNNSAMDGIAICLSHETRESGYEVVGASYAGAPYEGEVKQGQAIRIMTGAMLPQEADTVVPVEDIEERGDKVYLGAPPDRGQHVRYRGEEFRKGDTLVAPGTRLGAGEIALLASAGVQQVMVTPRPRIAVISTGDELVPLHITPGPGQIVNSNMYLLAARLEECGCRAVCIGIGPDDPDSLDKLLVQALDCDAIITTGGVSVGDKDHVQETLKGLEFNKIFWKVAIKPGKPLLFGTLAGKPFFGLPGNPASTAATFELFVKPALRKLAGQAEVLPAKRQAILSEDVKGGGKRQLFLWCQLEWQDNAYRVKTSRRQSSGQNRCLTNTNAMLPVPIGVETIAAGEKVEVLLL